MIRARQRRATFIKKVSKRVDTKGKDYEALAEFLRGFAWDLNHLSESGWTLLIEGPRDAAAVRRLGYRGDLTTVGQMGRRGLKALGGATKVVILTDLDREGALLASRSVRFLSNAGVKASLSERRRLKAACRGAFHQVENLGRFAAAEA